MEFNFSEQINDSTLVYEDTVSEVGMLWQAGVGVALFQGGPVCQLDILCSLVSTTATALISREGLIIVGSIIVVVALIV